MHLESSMIYLRMWSLKCLYRIIFVLNVFDSKLHDNSIQCAFKIVIGWYKLFEELLNLNNYDEKRMHVIAHDIYYLDTVLRYNFYQSPYM